MCKCHLRPWLAQAKDTMHVATLNSLLEQNARYREALVHIKKIADNSEGVGLYADIADRALRG